MSKRRHTASTITDDALDKLYANATAGWRRGDEWKARAEAAEAAVERVRQIHNHGTRTDTCNDCGQPWPCEVIRALAASEENSSK
ncbi:hypothetical protein [Streptomyces sp. NPDC002265]|uniref:hypothetical protein n=1 Tax=Streptomyces sp. NPDC002265 TaxID=3154415 RepID=UPI003327B72C